MPLTSSLAGGSNIGSGAGGARADILLVLKFMTQGLKEAEKARKEIEKLNKAAGKTGEGTEKTAKSTNTLFSSLKKGAAVAGVTAAALFGVGKALSVVLDKAREGAAFRQMVESFDMLGDSVGADTDLLYQLRQASRGTIDDMNLMSSAAVTLAGAEGEFGQSLSDNLPRILEIAKAAEKVNPALGNTDFMFRSLTVGLKRLSPRLIDNTGLQVRLSEAYDQLAEKLGKNTDELTAEEQQLALLNATLEAGAILIKQAGGNVESATDIYAQWGANVENLKNTMKAFLDLNFGQKFMTSVNLLVFGNQQVEDSYERQIELIRTQSDSFGEYVKKVTAVALATGQITKEQRDLMLSAAGLEVQLEGVYDGLTDEQQIKIAEGFMERIGIILDAQFELKRKLREETTKLKEEEKDLTDNVLSLGNAYNLAKNDTEKIRLGTLLFGDALNQVEQALLEEHLALLQTSLATRNLTDEQRAHVDVIMETIEAELDFNKTLRDTAQAEREVADEARNAKSAFQTMFEGLMGTSALTSAITGMKDTIAFYQAGGAEITNLWTAIELAIKNSGGEYEKFLPLLDILLAKTQMIGVETGDISNYEAVVTVMREMDIEYDKGLAALRAQELYKRRILELEEEGKDITDERIRKTKDWATLQAELEQKYVATLDLFKDMEGVDLASLFTDVLPPEWLTPEGFAGLTDDLQTALTNAGITPFDPTVIGDPASWLPEGTLPEDIDISVKPYFSSAAPEEVKALISNDVPDASMDLNVTDNMNPALKELIVQREIYTTVHVNVITTGDESQLATGGHALANQPYIVGERGPELFMPGQSGYVVPNNQLPSLLGGPNINVSVEATVANDIDLDLLARSISQKIYENQKRRM